MPDRHLHLTCREVVEIVSDYLERALDAGDMALFEQHLNSCGACVSYVEQVRTTVAAVSGLGAAPVPEETKARLLTAFREWGPR